ncbi:ATPase [Bacteroidetes bacterium SCGC AAA795-G10]|nr:ATPase [Bacteroidetes bacterium SCGC AAA795-G10]
MSNIRRILITGSPGSGKTTIIKGLRKKGYMVFYEFSRSLIKSEDNNGSKNLFLKDPIDFSTKLLDGRVKQFNDAKKIKKAKNNLVFYDRGIQEIFGYLKAIGLEKSSWKKKLTDYRYDMVFIAPPWKEIYVNDKERFETFKESRIYYHFIKHSYQIIHELIEIPKIDIESRIDFVESYVT